MKKILFPILALVLAVGLALPMATPALAADIALSKGVTPASPNIYYLGDTIHYTMSVGNIHPTETIRIDNVYDTLPDSTVVILDSSADPLYPDFPYFLGPGGSQSYTLDWATTTTGLVVNYLNVVGVQLSTVPDAFNAQVQKSSLVISPCIDIEKTVDCNDDGVFLDEDMGYAGDTGHWRIVVTNCSDDATLYDVMTTDTNGQSFGPIDLAPGASVQYDYDTIVLVDTTNVATVTALDEFGETWTATDDATNVVISPCIDIEKTVDCNDDGIFLDEDTGTAGDTGHWRIVVTNCSDVATLYDVMTTDTNGQSFGPIDLAPGASVQYDYDTIVNETTTNVATAVGYDVFGETWTATDDATNTVVGMEGCTPGFWKNNADKHEASAWVGYSSTDLFDVVFGVDVTLRGKGKITFDNPTLLQALDANGGGINALARHATAALLNICNPNIAYAGGMTDAELKVMVQTAIDAGEDAIQALHIQLAGYNEAGCSVNQQGLPIIIDGDETDGY